MLQEQQQQQQQQQKTRMQVFATVLPEPPDSSFSPQLKSLVFKPRETASALTSALSRGFREILKPVA